MALYNKPQEQSQQVVACHTGYAISDRVVFYRKEHDPLELGVKKFHCLRRFAIDAIPQKCSTCLKDMTGECFYVHKKYYSREIINILIAIYSDKAKKGIGSSTIWWDDQYASQLVKAIANPNTAPPIKPVKEDYFQRIEDNNDHTF